VQDQQTALATVKEYYGKILKGSHDLQTSACCSTESFPPGHRAILAEIDSEILDRFYGCGSPIPAAIEGCTVLDLGCGSGRDVYLASKLVGPRGQVIGLDMTDEQLAVARRHVESQTRRFGFAAPNVDFRQGYIEDLAASGIADNSVDLVISNCVINLSPDKERVMAEIFRVLKPGGELYFSDVFADRRMPPALKNDPLLYGECLGGALYIEDFRRLLAALGCPDYRVVTQRPISLNNPDIAAKAGMINFSSLTVRAFKLACLEDICEDFGQVATYRGTIPGSPHNFILDDHHTFFTGKPMLVCGNTAAMLQETRFGRHFKVSGDRSVHFGAFPCGPVPAGGAGGSGTSCC
jgi:arsenite methyltransferase